MFITSSCSIAGAIFIKKYMEVPDWISQRIVVFILCDVIQHISPRGAAIIKTGLPRLCIIIITNP